MMDERLNAERERVIGEIAVAAQHAVWDTMGAKLSFVEIDAALEAYERKAMALGAEREQLLVELLTIAKGYMRCDGEGWCANASRNVREVCGACKSGPRIRAALTPIPTAVEEEHSV